MNTDASRTWQARPGRTGDLAGLQGLDGHDGHGAPPAADGDTWWVAVATDGPWAGRVAAALRLRRHIGHPVPQAWFRLGWAVHASAELGLYRRQRTLLLVHDLTGADELGGFAVAPGLAPDDAVDAWEALLQVALQALQEGATAGREPQPCIAQLPGTRDEGGRSPVWQGLGRHFHAQDLDAARRQHGPEWACHVASLLPRHLLYASLLPAAAQAALGQPAAAAAPLRQALLRAGFGPRDRVGIVDGGPVLERWPPPSASD